MRSAREGGGVRCTNHLNGERVGGKGGVQKEELKEEKKWIGFITLKRSKNFIMRVAAVGDTEGVGAPTLARLCVCGSYLEDWPGGSQRAPSVTARGRSTALARWISQPRCLRAGLTWRSCWGMVNRFSHALSPLRGGQGLIARVLTTRRPVLFLRSRYKKRFASKFSERSKRIDFRALPISLYTFIENFIKKH